MKVTSFGCYWCNPLVSSWETNVQSGSFFAYLPCQSQSRPQIRSVHPLHILSMSILNILLDDRFPQHQHSKLLRFKSRHHHGRLYFLDDQRHRDDCLVAELPTRAILLAEQSSQERQKVGRLIRIMMMIRRIHCSEYGICFSWALFMNMKVLTWRKISKRVCYPGPGGPEGQCPTKTVVFLTGCFPWWSNRIQ